MPSRYSRSTIASRVRSANLHTYFRKSYYAPGFPRRIARDGVTNGSNISRRDNEFLEGAVRKRAVRVAANANKSRRKRRRYAPEDVGARAEGRKSRASFHSINFPNDPDWIYRQVGRNQLPLRIPDSHPPPPLSESGLNEDESGRIPSVQTGGSLF